MRYEYDLITIGLGPAGMAVSVMGSKMGLKVAAIERRKVGGECMNVGCIPSKALLRIAKTRHTVQRFEAMALEAASTPGLKAPFAQIQGMLQYINDKKTMGLLNQVDLVLGEGSARFVDDHTVEVNGRPLTARRIFIATGTRPMVPPIPGMAEVAYLTNETIFDLDAPPASMTIIGGGAIGAEMAQAFARLGTRCAIVQMDPHLVPLGDPEAGHLLEGVFRREGIEVYNSRRILRVAPENGGVALFTDRDEKMVSDRLLVAAGRKIEPAELRLENAGVFVETRGAIKVNRFLQTTRPHIYAVGDCNGHWQLSHAAMHQGMLALMNSMLPRYLRRDFTRYAVPWTVFTDPPISQVGLRETDLQQQNKRYEILRTDYSDYGAALAEGVGEGFVKAYVSPTGRIYGASITGESSGEMINEWTLAIQKKTRIHEIMMLQHAFPTMGFMSKQTADKWLMGKMHANRVQRLSRFMFRR